MRSLFFFFSFLFLPPLHCNNSSRLCGAKCRCAIRRQRFQLVLPEGEKGGTEWLKYAPVHRLEIHKALLPKCCLLLYLVLSCYTYHSTTTCEYTYTHPRLLDTMEVLCPREAKSNGGPPYICIHPQCGACGQLFLPGDHIVACKMGYMYPTRNNMFRLTYPVLFRNTTCLVYDACKFTAKGYAQQPKRGDHTFYKIPDRPLTTDAEESITMHTDCFKLCHQAFKSYTRDSSYKCDHKEDFRRLWLAATWRYAWKSMAPLKLPSRSTLMDPSPSLISKLCGFKKEFLPEIAMLIQSYSQSSVLWRLDATLQLAEELSLAKAEEAITCSLSEVLYWSRHGSPRFVQDELADPFVCLIIDSQGIRSIDRISEFSASLAAQMSIHPNVLMIEPVEAIKSIDIEFKVCTLHVLILTPLIPSLTNVPSSGGVAYTSPLQQASTSGAHHCLCRIF